MSQQIDWPGIRAAAVAVGVREAARRAAANLPDIEQQRFVNRVLQRSSREKWIATVKTETAQPLTKTQAKPMSSNVISGSQSLVNALQADSDATKTALAKAIRKGVEHLAEGDGQSVVKAHHATRNLTGSAAQLHGWDAKNAQQTNVMVNVALMGVDPGSVQADARIVDELA